MSEPRYPEIEVQLSGEDGNAMMILVRVRRTMKNAGLSSEQIDEFSNEAMSGDYDHLLLTCMRYVTVL